MKLSIVISIVITTLFISGLTITVYSIISNTSCLTDALPQDQNNDEVEDFALYFGPLTADAIQWAKEYDLVVLHPSFNQMSRASVAEIQAGCDPNNPDDDVTVLAHVTIGEDLRTVDLSDDELRNIPTFIGNEKGPRRDPRDEQTNNLRLPNESFIGLPSNGGTKFASYYLDDISIANSPSGMGDGIPDRHGISGAAFTNPGDSEWFQTLKNLQYHQDFQVSGLDEIYTTDYGRGLGFDGFFIDMVDIAAPNYWTTEVDSTQTEFEWVASGVQKFIRRLRETYPNSTIMQNRGLFFFTPNFDHYEFSTREYIDYLLIECFRSCSAGELNSVYYADNLFGYLPYLSIESNRNNGFKLLSLGFSNGLGVPEATLRQRTDEKIDLVYEDMMASIQVGMIPFVTNQKINLHNNFAKSLLHKPDTSPPSWLTLKDTSNYSNETLLQPTYREGIQRTIPTLGGMIVQWDVAADLSGIEYVLSYQTQPFNFDRDDPFSDATRLILTPRINQYYQKNGLSQNVYPYEQLITELDSNTEYYLHIQAVDKSMNRNGDNNQTVLIAKTS
jgi:hypothetical protein